MWLPTKPLVDLPLPKWEHGLRSHGYWLGNQRVGFVGLTPPGFPVVYSWSLDRVPEEQGECKSLRAAKRRVEAAFRRAYSWRFPASRR
jgi:hypothetical protein